MQPLPAEQIKMMCFNFKHTIQLILTCHCVNILIDDIRTHTSQHVIKKTNNNKTANKNAVSQNALF
jgi:molybdenum cofactor biosynthesis enzyme